MRERVGAALPNTKAEAELVQEYYDLFLLNHYSTTVFLFQRHGLRVGKIDRVVVALRIPVGSRALRIAFSCPPRAHSITRPAYRQVGAISYRLHDRNADILLTENGWCGNETTDNHDQLWYFQTHLDQVYKAITEDVIPILGYHAWSFVNNYEWGNYKQRYALYYVNFTNETGAINEATPDTSALQRIPRSSVTWYAETATSKCIPDEL